ncbi:MAG: hypothetical protein DMD91_07040 [Candidatus Rokuibacteriota bacterium]|nr:MAG: hypothetical protein DMD91_07040 [Candidatus Rokubacteria bacterium]
MRYLLLSCSDDKAAPPLPRAEMDALIKEHMRFSEKLRTAGKAVVGEALRPESEASRIRLKAGQRHVTDGPFAETKEALGGFYVIECDSREEALEWAKQVPLREGRFIEVRPIWKM